MSNFSIRILNAPAIEFNPNLITIQTIQLKFESSDHGFVLEFLFKESCLFLFRKKLIKIQVIKISIINITNNFLGN